MNAYVKFKGYDPNFYTDAFAHAVKGDGAISFYSALKHSPNGKIINGNLEKTLKDGRAMYLYGGRKALVREFRAFRYNFGADFVLKPADKGYLAVFHGKVTVDRNKTKRILMILSFPKTGWPPTVIDDRRLKVNLGAPYQSRENINHGFYDRLDLAGLHRIVHDIPD